MLRRLRIAASVFFAVVTVALCVLWVRSYWREDNLFVPAANKVILVGSQYGNVGIRTIDSPYMRSHPKMLFQSHSIRDVTAGLKPAQMKQWKQDHPLFFQLHRDGVLLSHFFLLASIIGLTALPWLPWRFSLHTMLIVTTLVAVVLGLVVWIGR